MTIDTKTWPKQVIIYTDGASRGNPGPASIGVHVTDLKGEAIAEIAEALGVQTNNYAEYTAVLRALQSAIAHGVTEVTLRSDSQLMIRQMLGEYKVKSESILPLFLSCQQLVRKIDKVHFEHVRREFNKEADALANRALDNKY